MSNIRVFLVDDTAAVRHILTQILEEDQKCPAWAGWKCSRN